MNRRTLFRVGALCATLLVSTAAIAEDLKLIDGARIRLADIAEVESDELAEVDLGPAPPPGSSRLLSRDEVIRELRAQGFEPRGLKFPPSVRVGSAARRYTPTELSSMIQPGVEAALPYGVKLKQLRNLRPLNTSPRLKLGRVNLPKLPRRSGPLSLTVTVELMRGQDVMQRVPVTLELEISEQAAQPVIRRGARLDLVIQRGSARISAGGTALDDGEIGEVVSFKVSTTQRVLRARIESASAASVVTP
ncbi:MAG TPA: flagella basal body P-ring formation protein FlgA [Polyangiales bacterium]|nr:flagella basal body P-ring formation protein FlgA [Polyangiales bacterium]